MNSRMRRELDNYITGHYGEDQFKDYDAPGYRDCRGEDFPDTAHAEYILGMDFANVYTYDAAENGPECEVITRILASRSTRWPLGRHSD